MALCDDLRTPVSFVRHNVKQSYISRAVSPRIAKFYMGVHAYLVYSHYGYDVISYFRWIFIKDENTAENAASHDDFVSNLSDTPFCIPYQLVGFLLRSRSTMSDIT